MASYSSKKYPDAALNQKKFADLGVISNAVTTDYMTYYYACYLKENMDEILDYFINVHNDFKLDEATFVSEKNAVKNELSVLLDPTTKLLMKINNVLFRNLKKGTNLSKYYDIQLRFDEVTDISIEEIYKFKKQNYNDVYVTIAGDFNTKATLKKLSTLKTKCTKSKACKDNTTKHIVPLYDSSLSYVKAKESNSNDIIIQYKVKETAENLQLLSVFLRKLLVESMESILFKRLRLQENLIYSVSLENNIDPINPEMNYIQIVTSSIFSPTKIKSIIFEELHKLGEQGIDKTRFNVIKKQISTINALQSYNIMEIAEFCNASFWFNSNNEVLNYKKFMKRLLNLDYEYVNNFLKSTFSNTNKNYIIGFVRAP
jgi:predicted Zn-dependent peptidase